MINGIMVLVLAIVVLAIVWAIVIYGSAHGRIRSAATRAAANLVCPGPIRSASETSRGNTAALGALVSEPRLLVAPHAVPGLDPAWPPAGGDGEGGDGDHE